MISCNCQACGAGLRVDEKNVGKKVRCPKCSQPTLVVAPPQSGLDQNRWPPGMMPPTNSPSGTANAAPKPAVPAAVPLFPQPKSTPAGTKPTPLPSAKPIPPTAVPIPPSAVPVRTVATPVHAAPSTPPTKPPAGDASEGGFSIVGSDAKSLGRSRHVKPKKSDDASGRRMWIIGGGVGAGSLALVLVLVALGSMGGKPKAIKTAGKPQATLIFNWPEDERRFAKVVVGKNVVKIPASGTFEVAVTPGSHKLIIQRRNYETVTDSVALSENQRLEYTPAWRENQIALVETPMESSDDVAMNASEPPAETPPVESSKPTAPMTTAVADNGGDASFEIGSGVIPRGFEGGWLQSLAIAKKKSTAENKTILMLFGSSDGSPKTARLASALREAGLLMGDLAGKFVPVVIDFPQTRAAGNNVLDLKQNLELARDYGIENTAELPVVVLCDSQGRPFAVERDWSSETDGLTEKLTRLAEQLVVRDELLAQAADGDPMKQLSGAAAVVKLLLDRRLIWHYRSEIHTWFAAAEKFDPDNAQGLYETILEAEFFLRLRTLNPNDSVAVVNSIGMLDSFLKRKKFVDGDRGAKMHLLAGQILINMNDEEQGLAHFARAVEYTPKDRELNERIGALRTMMANKDVLGNGTGFVVAEGGYLLTNRHVVEGNGRLVVKIPNVKEPIPTEIVKIAEDLDAALIKVSFPKEIHPKPLPLSITEARLSMGVSAYGFPSASVLGDNLKATSGTVSSIPRADSEEMIALDVLINPGNSGGPLCDKRGHVVGMVTAKTLNDVSQNSYGLAIQSAKLRAFLKANLPKSVVPPRPTKKTDFGDWADVTEHVQDSVFLLLKLR